MTDKRKKTRYIFLSGKGKYVMFGQPNKWGKHDMVLYPNAESLEIIRDLQAEGLRNTLKKDEDGYYISLSRRHQQEIRGKIVFFGPPLLLEADGKSLLGEKVRVGHGSDVTAKIEVYSYITDPVAKTYGVAARLESIRIDNLIPYVVERDGTETEQKQIKDFDKQPEQLF